MGHIISWCTLQIYVKIYIYRFIYVFTLRPSEKQLATRTLDNTALNNIWSVLLFQNKKNNRCSVLIFNAYLFLYITRPDIKSKFKISNLKSLRPLYTLIVGKNNRIKVVAICVPRNTPASKRCTLQAHAIERG